ncbi:MAG: HAD family phosphatase [Pleurocapsa minor GSE-CHR-MK-17-07R]|jgi:HAD superfamily hydrolase (TIGR01509 family)|nr:HAD family phosphatase [Pleurocapsa minor GSE-CHR-MK 17-07R]
MPDITLNGCPRAVIFDMDGLLVNSEPVWEVIEDAILAERGKVLTAEGRSPLIGRRMADFWQGMKETFGLDDPIEDLVADVIQRFLENLPAGAPEQPGASELIAFLHAEGVPIAIASSSPNAIIDGVVTSRGWLHYFPVRVSGDEVAAGKPAPDVFIEAARRLGVEPSQCLILEDSRNGVRAAVASGATCIAVPDFSHVTLDELYPLTPHIADNLHQVQAALAAQGCFA